MVIEKQGLGVKLVGGGCRDRRMPYEMMWYPTTMGLWFKSDGSKHEHEWWGSDIILFALSNMCLIVCFFGSECAFKHALQIGALVGACET